MRNEYVALLLLLGLTGCDGEEKFQKCQQAAASIPEEAKPQERVDALYEARYFCVTASEAWGWEEEAQVEIEKLDALLKEAIERRDRLQSERYEKEQAARAKRLRKKIRAKWGPFTDRYEPDSRCVSEGKPPYMLEYTGGTYEENEIVAKADGCEDAFFKSSVAGMQGPEDNQYCCPKGPGM